jgi:hypothetical protein
MERIVIEIPAVASSLLIDGKILSQTSFVGPGTPNLHPAVWNFVNSLPDEKRRGFTGRCAESALISDKLWEMDAAPGRGRITTIEEAASAFSGAALVSRMIREPHHPYHGKPATPCPACYALLEALGVEIIY